MLQKFSFLSLILGALLVFGNSSCSKPLLASQARALIIGTWKLEGNGGDSKFTQGQDLTFSKDGKLSIGTDNNKEYKITARDRITIDGKEYTILVLTTKKLKLRADGKETSFVRI